MLTHTLVKCTHLFSLFRTCKLKCIKSLKIKKNWFKSIVNNVFGKTIGLNYTKLGLKTDYINIYQNRYDLTSILSQSYSCPTRRQQ